MQIWNGPISGAFLLILMSFWLSRYLRLTVIVISIFVLIMTELVLADHAPMSYTPSIGTQSLLQQNQITIKTLSDLYVHFILVFANYSQLLQWNDYHHLPSIDIICSELLAGSFQKYKNKTILWIREYSL